MWSRHLAALLKYRDDHGTCNIHGTDSFECILQGMGDDGEDVHYLGKLGQWLHHQRQKKRGTRKPALTPQQETALQELVDQGR